MLETKADLTYQTVAAACPLISTTDPQIIINAALKEIDVIGVVTGKEYTPVGTYGFACESDPSTFFLLKENRMLAQVKQTNANNQPFQQGIFRSVALSNIEACKCAGEEIVELVVRPATNKAKENTIGTNDVWFDSSVCRSNLRDCLIFCSALENFWHVCSDYRLLFVYRHPSTVIFSNIVFCSTDKEDFA